MHHHWFGGKNRWIRVSKLLRVEEELRSERRAEEMLVPVGN